MLQHARTMGKSRRRHLRANRRGTLASTMVLCCGCMDVVLQNVHSTNSPGSPTLFHFKLPALLWSSANVEKECVWPEARAETEFLQEYYPRFWNQRNPPSTELNDFTKHKWNKGFAVSLSRTDPGESRGLLRRRSLDFIIGVFQAFSRLFCH